MSKFEDFKKYTDRFGLIQDNIGEPALAGSYGALMTVEYFFLLNDLEKKIETQQLKLTLKLLEQKTPNGIVTIRYPGSNTTDSVDNAIALIIFSELFDDSRLSKQLYRHGELVKAKRIDENQDQDKNFKTYPIAWILSGFKPPRRFYNVRPNDWSLASWWEKDIPFMGLLELSALNRTSFFKLAALAIGLFFPLLKNHPQKIQTQYLIWQWLKTKNKKWKAAYQIWIKLLFLKYKNGMKDVYKTNYGKEHPITKHAITHLT